MFESKKFLIAVATVLTIALLSLARTFAVGANHFYISNAILAYKMDCIHKFHIIDSTVNFDDMEDFNKTWLRLWDWSNRRILDTDKYFKIRPYIGEVVFYD